MEKIKTQFSVQYIVFTKLCRLLDMWKNIDVARGNTSSKNGLHTVPVHGM